MYKTIMKKQYLLFALVAMFLSSCTDFLNQPAYDDFTDDEFWKSEDQARSFMYSFYPTFFSGYGSGYSHGPFLMGETGNDDFVSGKEQQNLQPEVVPESNGSWSFTTIRKANYVIENVDRMDADAATKNHWRGLGRFFRACSYSNLVFTFGDVPWFDRMPKVSNDKAEMDYLYKDRDPRTYVDSLIMEDFRYALNNVRVSDGALQVNMYVVAGMVSRFMLREGTYLKYHNVDLAMAEKCLRFAKEAALIVMNSGKYAIAPSYTSLFVSEDLSANPEVLMYRHYEDGVLAHSTLAYSYTEAQSGCSKSLAMAFTTKDGLPVYCKDEFWIPRNAEEFFKDRDPRLTFCIRPHYYIKGTDCTPYGYALSGFSWRKFMDDENVSLAKPTWAGSKNVTDAPCLRYAEVLLNYAEAAYELAQLNPAETFTDADLDKSINVIRARADVNLPALHMSGDRPMIGANVFDDPIRLEIENEVEDEAVSSILWEIRRERRVELCMEGFRHNDLVRWKRLDYLWNGCNPDIRFGAYIVASDYTPDELAQGEVVFEDPSATEGWLLRNTINPDQRQRPIERNYISPVPSGQITLYQSHGYTLTQTKEWQN